MQSLDIKIHNQLAKVMATLEETGLQEQIKKAKEAINMDQQTKELIEEYNRLSINPYDSQFKKIRLELFANHKFIQYQNLLNQESQLILEINQRLSKITKKRKCYENY